MFDAKSIVRLGYTCALGDRPMVTSSDCHQVVEIQGNTSAYKGKPFLKINLDHARISSTKPLHASEILRHKNVLYM